MTDLFLLINSVSSCVFSLQAGEQCRGGEQKKKKKGKKGIYDNKSNLTVTPAQPKVKDRRSKRVMMQPGIMRVTFKQGLDVQDTLKRRSDG